MIDRALLVMGRELRAERRHPDGLAAALAFVGMLVLLETLAFGPVLSRDATVASGAFWIAMLFASILVAARAFDRELEDDAIDAVIVIDGGRDALYVGKIAALVLIIGIVAVAGGVFALALLSLDVALPLHLALVTVLGIAALPPVVGLVSFIALRVRARVALVPIMSFPLLVPQVIAATAGAAAAITGEGGAALAWSGILAAFALVYGVLGLTIVPAAIE